MKNFLFLAIVTLILSCTNSSESENSSEQMLNSFLQELAPSELFVGEDFNFQFKFKENFSTENLTIDGTIPAGFIFVDSTKIIRANFTMLNTEKIGVHNFSFKVKNNTGTFNYSFTLNVKKLNTIWKSYGGTYESGNYTKFRREFPISASQKDGYIIFPSDSLIKWNTTGNKFTRFYTKLPIKFDGRFLKLEIKVKRPATNYHFQYGFGNDSLVKAHEASYYNINGNRVDIYTYSNGVRSGENLTISHSVATDVQTYSYQIDQFVKFTPPITVTYTYKGTIHHNTTTVIGTSSTFSSNVVFNKEVDEIYIQSFNGNENEFHEVTLYYKTANSGLLEIYKETF